MIATNFVPAAPASATQQTIAVQVTEKLCAQVNIHSKAMPIGTMMFTAGEPVVNGTIVIVPITVSGSIVYQPVGCCQAKTKMFVETFSVGFSATANNNITIAPSGIVTGAYGPSKCCKTNVYSLYSSVGITIS